MGDTRDDGTTPDDVSADTAPTAGEHGNATGDATTTHDNTRPSRRDFLRVGGAAAAGAAVGGVAGYAVGSASAGQNQAGPAPAAASDALMQPEGTIPPRPGGPGFDHLVVVMFENRSFDNLLGYLYATTGVPEGQAFAGLNEGPFGNADLEGRHCAVPGPTFANRSFFHASTSHGFVTNHDSGGYAKWRKAEATPTIFNRLEEAGISWCVYYDEHQRVSLTGLIHEPVLRPYWHSRFRPMRDFYEACADGTLPAYAFIEPRMVYDHNDMHPPVGDVRTTEVDGSPVTGGAISDVRAGEALLHEIYTVIRASSSPSGSNAMNTMLLVTFDEHGGTFDHVPPPAAVPPGGHEGGDGGDAESGDGGDTGDRGTPGEMGFTFDRLGSERDILRA